MNEALAKRFRRAKLDPATAVFVERRSLTKDPRMIGCDGWLLPASRPTALVGGALVYVDLEDDDTFWHRYYCGEEHNPNRVALGRGLVGWVISRFRVDNVRRDVERWAATQAKAQP